VEQNLIEIFESSKTISEVSMKLFGKINSTTIRKTRILINDNGYDWDYHIKQMKDNNKKYCIVCGKLLDGKYQRRFCSCSCAAKYNNSHRIVSDETKIKISEALIKDKITNSVKQLKITKERFCKVCGKELLHRQTIYCSKKCKMNHDQQMYEKYISDWKNGNEDGVYSDYVVDKRIRRYLHEKYNSKCQKCGWGEINSHTNKVPLQIHHLDGDCTNNKEDNLQLLCPNCHSLTENFGSRNKNSKRIYRKQIL